MSPQRFGQLLFCGESMKAVCRTAAQAARTAAPVLVMGETGTGKELLAHAIHDYSGRRGRLVAVNCSALPETLIEGELFGHERGAFTGANSSAAGAFERADGGTLFLDEVTELSVVGQAKLLRVLDTGQVSRLGSWKPQSVDARIVAATNRSPDWLKNSKNFRDDLFFRLAMVKVTMPPLRHRLEDLRVLVPELLVRVDRTLAGVPLSVVNSGDYASITHADNMLLGAIAPRWNDSAGMAELVAALERYSWPGNVRELQSVLFQARMAAGDRAWVTAEEVIKVIEAQLPASTEEPAKSLGESRPLPDDAKSLPKKPRPPLNEEHLRALLEQQGSATAVARSLGVARVTVYRWMRKFGLS